MTNRTRYDLKAIDAHIASVHAKVGDEPFTRLGMLALERLVRDHDPLQTLPTKTLLRERLNAYRTELWPALAPKKIYRRW